MEQVKTTSDAAMEPGPKMTGTNPLATEPRGRSQKPSGKDKRTKKSHSSKSAHQKKVLPPCSYGGACKFQDPHGARFCRFQHPKGKEEADATAPVAETAVPGGAVVVGAVASTPVVPVAPLKPRPTELGEHYALQEVVVPGCEEHVITYARARGWNVGVNKERSAIPHPLSHVAREVASLAVASAALRGKREVRILCVYGAQRDKRLFEILKAHTEKGLKVEVTIGPNEVYPGDAGKLTIVRGEPTGLYQLVVFTDIYWGKNGAFAPSDAKYWAQWSADGSIYWIGRCFVGAAGADVVENYGGPTEGVWFRDEEGLINFSSDSAGFGYPRHPSVDWLQHKTIEGLSVTYVDTKGPYNIFKIAIETQDTIRVEVKLQEALEGSFSWKKRETSWFQLVSHTWTACLSKRTRWLVHNPTVVALGPTFKYKVPLGHTADVARGQVAKLLEANQVFVALKSRWPALANKVLCDTADCAMYAGRETAAQEQYDLREAHQTAEKLLVSARAPTFISIPRLNARTLRVFFAMVVAWIFLTWIQSIGVHARIYGPFEGELRGDEWWLGTFLVTSMILLANYINRSSRSSHQLFDEWQTLRAERQEQFEVPSGWCALTESDTILAEQADSMSFAIGRGEVAIEVDGIAMSVEQAAIELWDEPVKQGVQPVIVTNGMPHQPAKTDLNLLAAVIQRVHTAEKGEQDPKKLQAIWGRAGRRLSKCLVGTLGEKWTIADCAAAMGGEKAKRLLNADESQELGKLCGYRKEIMVKWNETIPWKVVDGQLTVKPRAITVLSNDLHVNFAPDARGVADVLHRVFGGSLHGDVVVYFASGYTGEQLNAMGSILAGGNWNVVAVSGDDSITHKVTGWQHQGVMQPIGEGDFSAYDQSQREECLRAHAHWLAAIGVAPLVIDLILTVCSMPYKARGKRVRIRGKAGFQLATGIDWTTVINSMSNLCYWLEVFAMGRDPEQAAHMMGFELKFKSHMSLNEATFLKGWWVRDRTGEVCWFPLPSQVVKLGKTHRAVKLFSKSKRDYAEGLATLSYAISQSMAKVPEEYPILGPFIRKLGELGRRTTVVVSASEDGWCKPNVSSVSVDRAHAIDMICDRYGLTEADIVRAEKLIGAVTQLPAFLSDPVFAALSSKDYA